jgi:phi LC3 family holin
MSKINWKLRLQNKVTLLAIISGILDAVYMILAACGVAPMVDQSAVYAILSGIVKVLCLVGVVVDPTTSGIGDSQNALNYTEPKKEE